MSIKYVRNINGEENNRTEFLFINYDFFDGNDMIVKFFQEEFGATSEDKIDGMFYSIIKVYIDKVEYNLIWHEDVGNYIFPVQQDEKTINELEHRLNIIVSKLNEIIS